jgi:hypothetical protein
MRASHWHAKVDMLLSSVSPSNALLLAIEMIQTDLEYLIVKETSLW